MNCIWMKVLIGEVHHKIFCIIHKMNKINIDSITEINNQYPEDFLLFVKSNNLTPPTTSACGGKALVTMLRYPDSYFDRETCNMFCAKFNISTKDSIQLFNKHEQWGILSNTEKGKYYIPRPFQLSKKHKMRKNFGFGLSQPQKNAEIEKIKSTIKHDYVDVPNEHWQLGHKNPDSIDNSYNNLVLQPPIQAKYRDEYIFLDTLTKIPTAKTFMKLHKNNTLSYTNDQLMELKNYLNTLPLV
jgi:hypothetical protein